MFCFVFKLLCVFIYLFLAALALRSYAQVFPVAVSGGPLSSRGTGASLCSGFSCCGAQALG